MSLPTATKLGQVLAGLKFVEKAFTTADVKADKVPFVSNETFGSRSMVYLHADSPDAARKLVGQLAAKGIEASVLSGARSSVQVRVSYFKGWHWDE
jgi:hypothetical protein